MFNVTKITIRRLVLISTVMTLVSLGLMVASILFPGPFLLVVAIVTSQLAGRMRRLAGLAFDSAAYNATLIGFARHPNVAVKVSGIGLPGRRWSVRCATMIRRAASFTPSSASFPNAASR